jgi:hypothetical protein
MVPCCNSHTPPSSYSCQTFSWLTCPDLPLVMDWDDPLTHMHMAKLHPLSKVTMQYTAASFAPSLLPAEPPTLSLATSYNAPMWLHILSKVGHTIYGCPLYISLPGCGHGLAVIYYEFSLSSWPCLHSQPLAASSLAAMPFSVSFSILLALICAYQQLTDTPDTAAVDCDTNIGPTAHTCVHTTLECTPLNSSHTTGCPRALSMGLDPV